MRLWVADIGLLVAYFRASASGQYLPDFSHASG
jgi:hypothetical protein